VLAANPAARQGVNLGSTAIIAGQEAAGRAVLEANPDVVARPTGPCGVDVDVDVDVDVERTRTEKTKRNRDEESDEK